MQRGGRRWSFLTLGSTDKIGVVFYCEFFCLFAAFLVSSCWLPSMWGLSFLCCLAGFPSTWETATQASHSALTEGANSWTTVLLTANDKKFLQAWLILLYSVYRDPSWLNLPLTLRKKQEKSLLSTEQKSPLLLCYSLYADYATQSILVLATCVSIDSVKTYFSKAHPVFPNYLTSPMSMCLLIGPALATPYHSCFFLQKWLFAFSSLCTFSFCLFTWFPFPGHDLI